MPMQYQGDPINTFMKGIGTGSDMFSKLMQPIIQRENMARQWKEHQEDLAQRAAAHADAMAIQNQQQARLQAKFEQDQKNQAMLEQMFGGQQQSRPTMPTQEAGQGMGMFSPEGLDEVQQRVGAAQQTYDRNEALKQSPYVRALMKHYYGLDPNDSSVLQGPAREAQDLERLRQSQGENSPVYQMAKQAFESKQQARDDLSATRQRTLGGLKPGERWISDPQSGQPIGKEIPLTAKERDEYRGRGYFNHAFDYIQDGLGPLSGQGSISTLFDSANNYGKNPQATKTIDDFLLGKMLLASTTVKEAATLAAGRQKSMYEALNKSLDSADIPESIEKVIKMFGLPKEAMMKANKRFKQVINDATKAGEQAVPAYTRNLFNPETNQMEKQGFSSTGGYNDSDLVVVEGPNGEETMTYAQAKALGAV